MIPGTYHSGGPEETRALARGLARGLRPGAVLALCGDLGSGKTCFVQGLAEGLESAGEVSSPTFTLVHEYPGRLPLFHLDLYRLRGGREALEMGLDEYLFGAGVTAIEWADRIRPWWPEGTLEVRFSAGREEDDRIIEISVQGAGI